MKITTKNTSELHVRTQTLYVAGREVLEQFQVVETAERAFQTAIVEYMAGLIEVDVRMTFQLVERKTVEIEFPDGVSRHLEIRQ